MALELLLDDAPGPALLALAIERGWVTLPAAVRVVPGLDAATLAATSGALGLLPFTEYAMLQESHTILPELAAGGQHNAGIVLSADRRLDEIDNASADLAETSRAAECYARATLKKFYGITAARWVRDREQEAPGSDEPAQPWLEVREGGEALHLLDEPGGRTVVDLGRAWFILTGLPPLTHVLLAPDAALADDVAAVRALTGALTSALQQLQNWQDELISTLAEHYGVSREVASAFYRDQFLTLTGDAQKSLPLLFAQGAWGMRLPPVTRLKLAAGTPRV
ncbi:MAG: MqnA/MqnD/SBP family protein [Thermomicrobiales bacterium]